jgi:hypothetical protein
VHLPAEKIATLMAGRSTEEAKAMLFEGIELVPNGLLPYLIELCIELSKAKIALLREKSSR